MSEPKNPTFGLETPKPKQPLSINPRYQLAKHIAAEAQVSYLYSVVTSGFINGNESRDHEVQTLVGARFCINPNGSFRWSINALAGANYSANQNSGWAPGVSLGALVEKGPWAVGISAEATQFFLFKVGYRIGPKG